MPFNTYERNQKVQILDIQKELNAKILQRKFQQKKYECVRDYVQYKRKYIEYRRGGSQADFRNLHQKEIDGFLKAEAYLKSIGMVKPDGRMLKQILENELMPLNQEITELRRTVELHKQDLRDTATIRQIYEQTYGIKLEVDNGSLLSEKDISSAAENSKKHEAIRY